MCHPPAPTAQKLSCPLEGEPSAPEPAVVAKAEKRGSWGWAQVRPLSLLSHTPPEREKRWGGGRLVTPARGERTRGRNATGRAGVQPACFVGRGCVCISLRIGSGTECCTLSDSYERAPGGVFHRWPLFSPLTQIFHKYRSGTRCVPGAVLSAGVPQDTAGMEFAFLKEGVTISRFTTDIADQF